MAINFPSSPEIGDIFSYNKIQYAWDGSSWNITGGKSYTESGVAPVNPTIGDEWLNTNNGNLYKRVTTTSGSVWLDISAKTSANTSSPSYTESDVMPSDAKAGDEWFDTTDALLYKRVSNQGGDVWIDITGAYSTNNTKGQQFFETQYEPNTANVGDEWFNTNNGVLYKRVSVQSGEIWLDISS
jgi:hypothetical protein